MRAALAAAGLAAILALAATLALAVILALAAPASAEVAFITAEQSSFSPTQLDILVGDPVNWRNASVREHDIRSDTAGFDSGRLAPSTSFAHLFAAPGGYPYVCTIHAGMAGDVAVHPLLLDGPRAPVARGAPLALHVRAPDGVREAVIEEDTGGGFRRVAVATPPAGRGHEEHDAEGTLHATVTPQASASYRAVGAAGTSPPLRVEVTDRTSFALRAAAVRRGTVVRVSTRPSQPGARVVLQLRLRERFGWWTVARDHLDDRSRVAFLVRRRGSVRARVAVVGEDWATVLAVSRPLRARTPKRGR
jgi:plastocyanin